MDVRRLLGRNVQRLRLARGLSQEDLAEEAGVHRTYVSGVERGVRNPTVTIVAKLAKALGVSAADLLVGR
ncbi:MAG: helix-turn-helix transcriptional regulator [Hyphomonadaceae bacterium]|nr:helix-turn-helix transcriptional regulator [Hyphomonadaceae bacterium]